MSCYLCFRFPTFKQTQTEFIPIIEGPALPKDLPSLVFSAEDTNSVSLGGALGRVEATLKVSLFHYFCDLALILNFDQTRLCLPFLFISLLHTPSESHLFLTHWTIQWSSHWNKTNIFSSCLRLCDIVCFSICLCVMLLLVWQTVTTKLTQKSRWILSLVFLNKCEFNRFSLWFYFWKFILSFITREPLDNTVCRVWKNFLVILRKTFTLRPCSSAA